jgi:hypothetical protein
VIAVSASPLRASAQSQVFSLKLMATLRSGVDEPITVIAAERTRLSSGDRTVAKQRRR